MKKKSEPKSVGPVRDEDSPPWNGITLNRCLAVAAIAALLSMGFQVLQDAVEDELADVEDETWTSSDASDELTEPWFFEAWFGSSKAELPEVEQPEFPDDIETDLPLEVEEEAEEEEEVLTDVEGDETIETEEELITEEPQPEEKTESRKDDKKSSGQWGLKAKSQYMEVKAIKIRRAGEDGFQRRDVFPFHKKSKEPIKSFADHKEKSYKEKHYQKKYDEKKPDFSKKWDHGKPYKKEKEEHYKYQKEDKESKGYKPYHQEKKKHDSRHYG